MNQLPRAKTVQSAAGAEPYLPAGVLTKAPELFLAHRLRSRVVHIAVMRTVAETPAGTHPQVAALVLKQCRHAEVRKPVGGIEILDSPILHMRKAAVRSNP